MKRFDQFPDVPSLCSNQSHIGEEGSLTSLLSEFFTSLHPCPTDLPCLRTQSKPGKLVVPATCSHDQRNCPCPMLWSWAFCLQVHKMATSHPKLGELKTWLKDMAHAATHRHTFSCHAARIPERTPDWTSRFRTCGMQETLSHLAMTLSS